VLFLQNPCILKVGVHIKADLTRLAKDCGYESQVTAGFTGAIELGAIAKDRGLVRNSNTSLSDLTSLVLQHFLPKDESIRINTNWDNPVLGQEQQLYAALDAYASWKIYSSIYQPNQTSQSVSSATPAGTPVELLSRGHASTIAAGFTVADRPAKLRGVNVTNTRTIINVTDVFTPGYLIHGDLTTSKEETFLSAFGPTPFLLLCYMRDLKTCTEPSGSTKKQHTPLPPSSSSLPLADGDYVFDDSNIRDINELDTDFLEEAWHTGLEFDPDREQDEREATQDSDLTFVDPLSTHSGSHFVYLSGTPVS
jgi:3'-5' exonuclease